MKKVFDTEKCSQDMEALFKDDKKCLEFLSKLKWADGYVCSKCGNTNYCPGSEPYSRRCTRCKTKETATSGTVFHGIRFPLCKAFYIAYTVCKEKGEVSSYEYGRRLSLRQMTCWSFKNKVEQVFRGLDKTGADPGEDSSELAHVLKTRKPKRCCKSPKSE